MDRGVDADEGEEPEDGVEGVWRRVWRIEDGYEGDVVRVGRGLDMNLSRLGSREINRQTASSHSCKTGRTSAIFFLVRFGASSNLLTYPPRAHPPPTVVVEDSSVRVSLVSCVGEVM